ncbi:ABC transporter substrate-binding protein [Brachybacterium alimentarium]|uniref:ABC transporter substrate-binding protein n=1 Tax=Brachybacterium TaxID=43668 RepID=UPI001142A565|nr:MULTISPECIES: sugar ABC transporter substrate-binding protein [Brachybacterium]
MDARELNEEEMMTVTSIRRRSVLAGAGATALTVAVAGCGGEKASSTGALELWLPAPQGNGSVQDEKKVYEDLLAPFVKEHGTPVNLTLTTWDSYEERYLTGVSSGTGPDVGYMYTEMMGDYVDADAIVPVDEYLSQDARQRMFFLEEGKFDGHQYGVPYVVGNARVIWANQELLKQAGIAALPTTWDELAEVAGLAHRELGLPGIVMPWGNQARGMLNECYFPFMWQAGGEIFTEDGSRTAFNSPEGLEAAHFINDFLVKETMPRNVSGLNSDDIETMFLEGRTVFAPGSAAKLPVYAEEIADLGFIDSLTNATRATFVANDALVLTKKCPDKELGTALIEHLTAGESMEKFHSDVQHFPPIGSDERPNTDDPFSDTFAETDMLRGLPIMPRGNAAYNALFENLQQMVLGRKTPEQALSDASASGNAALAAGV